MRQHWNPELLLIASVGSPPHLLSTPEPGHRIGTHALLQPSWLPTCLGPQTDSCLVLSSSELEMAKARNQLDAVLQCLLEKSHMDRLGSEPAWGHRGLGTLAFWALWSWVDLGGTPEPGLGKKGPNGEATHFLSTLGLWNPEPTVLFCYQGASGRGSREDPLRYP